MLLTAGLLLCRVEITGAVCVQNIHVQLFTSNSSSSSSRNHTSALGRQQLPAVKQFNVMHTTTTSIVTECTCGMWHAPGLPATVKVMPPVALYLPPAAPAATAVLQARAVVVDMEEGVIQHMLKVRHDLMVAAAKRFCRLIACLEACIKEHHLRLLDSNKMCWLSAFNCQSEFGNSVTCNHVM